MTPEIRDALAFLDSPEWKALEAEWDRDLRAAGYFKKHGRWYPPAARLAQPAGKKPDTPAV